MYFREESIKRLRSSRATLGLSEHLEQDENWREPLCHFALKWDVANKQLTLTVLTEAEAKADTKKKSSKGKIAAMSEVSCENCTQAAVAAKKKKLYKGCYAHRDSGGVWTTPEVSGQGSHHGYCNS